MMFKIKSILFRNILNSHVDFTNEFMIELDDGRIGVGSSPKGETLSIYEQENRKNFRLNNLDDVIKDILTKNPFDQESFDQFLINYKPSIGRNNIYALSLAFFNTTNIRISRYLNPKISQFPRICFNILNGGWHAYTNPVQSDFSEYLIVPKEADIIKNIKDHEDVQRVAKEELSNLERIKVGDNWVYKSKNNDNREWFDLIYLVLKKLNLDSHYDLMIDASAGDLKISNGYHLPITNTKIHTREEFQAYWLDIINNNNIKFLEDPFHETDFESWQMVTKSQNRCLIIGDNLYCSNKDIVKTGIIHKYSHGLILKPDQAGTVSSTYQTIDIAKNQNFITILSHRSISTESDFLPFICAKFKINYFKIGPLFTDYSSVLRLNNLLNEHGL